MDKVVVSIGGSVLIPEKNDAAYISALADMLKDVAKEVCLMVVCGLSNAAYRREDGVFVIPIGCLKD